MKPDESGPAFPVIGMDGRNSQTFLGVYHTGMTLRDYFAAAALTGIHASYEEGYPDPQTAAKEAYAAADAMLPERSK